MNREQRNRVDFLRRRQTLLAGRTENWLGSPAGLIATRRELRAVTWAIRLIEQIDLNGDLDWIEETAEQRGVA